jgi:hypothetical protein
MLFIFTGLVSEPSRNFVDKSCIFFTEDIIEIKQKEKFTKMYVMKGMYVDKCYFERTHCTHTFEVTYPTHTHTINFI